MQPQPCTSVIIASHRPRLVEKLCLALSRQKMHEHPFEVIVVTDYPNGELQSRFSRFMWLLLADRNIGRKRNAGAAIARGRNLAFIDDDCIPEWDWVEQGCRYLAVHTGVVAVEGSTTILRDSAGSTGSLREYRRLEKPGFRTNNLFFRTDFFKALGGFDERFVVQREDMDLAFTALEKGYRIDYCDAIRVSHLFRSWEKWDLFKNCWNRRFDPLLFAKHPKNYVKTCRSPLPPSLGLVLLLHAASICRWPGKKRSTILCGVTDAALVSLLGLRRCGLRGLTASRWINETVQVLLAPLVVIAALMHGCVRRDSGPGPRRPVDPV